MKKIRTNNLGSLFLSISILLVLISWHSTVSAVDLNGQTVILSGSEVLKINKCCKEKGSVTLEVTFGVNDWVAVDHENDIYRGTYTSNIKGNKFFIEFDNGSIQDFNEELAMWGSDLSGENVIITSSNYSFQLKVSGKLRAKLIGNIKLKGSAGSKSGSAKYKVVANGDVLKNIAQCYLQDL